MIKIALKGLLIFIGLLTGPANIIAQAFQIGHTSINFYDESRNRNVETEIYYPADIPGENVAIASGNYPVIVFGHGFLMSWDSYENFWTELVPEGYVICFPRTEMSLSPSHEDFGLDLNFVATEMQEENNDNSSLFFNSLTSKTGLMGHSMGGGASFLAAENNYSINSLVNFAAAETNPSAISAAMNIYTPTLIFSGDDDCVAPPNENQNLMYENLNSNCKTHISILNGGHCYFANNNFNCNLGESFCNPSLDISREEQQSITFSFLKLWLTYTLYDEPGALDIFNDSLETSNQITYSQFCQTFLDVQSFNNSNIFNIYPNPVTDKLNIKMSHEELINGSLEIYNSLGIKIYSSFLNRNKFQVDLSGLSEGVYFLVYVNGSSKHSRRFIKIEEQH